MKSWKLSLLYHAKYTIFEKTFSTRSLFLENNAAEKREKCVYRFEIVINKFVSPLVSLLNLESNCVSSQTELQIIKHSD